jgi:hypothetical protein
MSYEARVHVDGAPSCRGPCGAIRTPTLRPSRELIPRPQSQTRTRAGMEGVQKGKQETGVWRMGLGSHLASIWLSWRGAGSGAHACLIGNPGRARSLPFLLDQAPIYESGAIPAVSRARSLRGQELRAAFCDFISAITRKRRDSVAIIRTPLRWRWIKRQSPTG